MIIGIIIFSVVIILLVGFLYFNKHSDNICYVETLGMKEIITFFKKPEVLTKIKKESDLIAVVIKEPLPNGKNRILACVFNNKKNTIIETPICWIANTLNHDLIESFGDKPMIVIQ